MAKAKATTATSVPIPNGMTKEQYIAFLSNNITHLEKEKEALQDKMKRFGDRVPKPFEKRMEMLQDRLDNLSKTLQDLQA
jgi:hypothetical protein